MSGQPDDTSIPIDLTALLGRMNAIAWYGVLGCLTLGSILEGSHARASEGKARKEIGERLHAHTISLFERAHRLIAAN